MNIGSDTKNEKKLDKIIAIRLGLKDLRILDREAKKAHLNRSEFLRSLLKKLGSEPSRS